MEKKDEIGGDTAKAVAKHTPGPWTINNSMSTKATDPPLQEYTVILQHPEYLPIDGGKFFFEHVRSLPENAEMDAQMAAHDRLTGPDDAATPSDWKVIACIPGRHSNLATSPQSSPPIAPSTMSKLLGSILCAIGLHDAVFCSRRNWCGRKGSHAPHFFCRRKGCNYWNG